MKYFGFADRDDVARQFEEIIGDKYKDFQVKPDFPTDDQILFAAYGGGCYEGRAIVVYVQDGKLFEVNGSHCSCYGLEGQWTPEETSKEALAIRKLDAYEFETEEIVKFAELFPPQEIRNEV